MCRQLFAVVAVTGVLGASFALSETRPAFEDFSAKRVKPPGAGSRAPRITVQIDPVEQARRLAPPEPVATAPDPVESADAVESATAESGKAASPKFAWFWEKLSPDLTGAGAGRLIDALDVLAGAEETVPAPRLQALQEIAVLRGVEILGATVGTRVSPALVLAVIAVESAGKVDAKSRAGAQGLMQLMPDTAARFGVTDSLSAQENIRGGVGYLDWLLREFDGDPILALAGYNAGEGAVRKHGGVPPYNETRDYVPKVLAAFRVARGLCLTPPVLASDGCVFAAMN